MLRCSAILGSQHKKGGKTPTRTSKTEKFIGATDMATKTSTDYTKMMQEMMASMPTDMSAYQDAFKSYARGLREATGGLTR